MKGIDCMNQMAEWSNQISTFSNDEFGTIRTIIMNGDPWFIAADVCKVLGISNTTDALNKGLESFEKARLNLGLQGGATNVISESGFYTLVLRSRKPVAKPFRIWVTSEVLPSIRKTGQYQLKNNSMENILANLADIKVVYAQINNIESMLEEQREDLKSVVENMTLSTHQQQKLYKAAKDRVNYLLGGAHSITYKENARKYFINLWNNLKAYFECGSSYKDLNPKYFNEALDFISIWQYVETEH